MRFAARLDVLTERVDTLAQTVATTASAMAKKDGEIAALRRELEVRDEQLRAVAARLQAPGGADPQQVAELRRAVETLYGERAKHGSSKQLEELSGKVALLGQRLETLATTVSTTAAGLAGREGEVAALRRQLETIAAAPAPPAQPDDPDLKRLLDDLNAGAVSTKLRLERHAADLDAVKKQLADQHAPAEELRTMLTTLRVRVEALDGLRAGLKEELDGRLVETDDALADVSRRVETLAGSVESAAVSAAEMKSELERRFSRSDAALGEVSRRLQALAGTVESAAVSAAENAGELDRRSTQTAEAQADLSERVELLAAALESTTAGMSEKEAELAELHRHFLGSSSRIEAIMDDLREALGAFREADPEGLSKLAAQLDSTVAGVSSLSERIERVEGAHVDELVRQLGERVEIVDKRLAQLAAEVSRAKTLWPVALRSLEARLDDVVERGDEGAPAETSDDSATDHDGGGNLIADLRDSLQAMENVAAEFERGSDGATPEESDDPQPAHEALAGGARVVPLRADP